MIEGAETFLSGQRVAELWERLKLELSAKQDKTEQDAATDGEVSEMLDEVFGLGGGYIPENQPTATEDEVEEMLDDVFGQFSGEPTEADTATDAEVIEMLDDVFGLVSK